MLGSHPLLWIPGRHAALLRPHAQLLRIPLRRPHARLPAHHLLGIRHLLLPTHLLLTPGRLLATRHLRPAARLLGLLPGIGRHGPGITGLHTCLARTARTCIENGRARMTHQEDGQRQHVHPVEGVTLDVRVGGRRDERTGAARKQKHIEIGQPVALPDLEHAPAIADERPGIDERAHEAHPVDGGQQHDLVPPREQFAADVVDAHAMTGSDAERGDDAFEQRPGLVGPLGTTAARQLLPETGDDVEHIHLGEGRQQNDENHRRRHRNADLLAQVPGQRASHLAINARPQGRPRRQADGNGEHQRRAARRDRRHHQHAQGDEQFGVHAAGRQHGKHGRRQEDQRAVDVHRRAGIAFLQVHVGVFGLDEEAHALGAEVQEQIEEQRHAGTGQNGIVFHEALQVVGVHDGQHAARDQYPHGRRDDVDEQRLDERLVGSPVEQPHQQEDQRDHRRGHVHPHHPHEGRGEVGQAPADQGRQGQERHRDRLDRVRDHHRQEHQDEEGPLETDSHPGRSGSILGSHQAEFLTSKSLSENPIQPPEPRRTKSIPAMTRAHHSTSARISTFTLRTSNFSSASW